MVGGVPPCHRRVLCHHRTHVDHGMLNVVGDGGILLVLGVGVGVWSVGHRHRLPLPCVLLHLLVLLLLVLLLLVVVLLLLVLVLLGRSMVGVIDAQGVWSTGGGLLLVGVLGPVMLFQRLLLVAHTLVDVAHLHTAQGPTQRPLAGGKANSRNTFFQVPYMKTTQLNQKQVSVLALHLIFLSFFLHLTVSVVL